MGILDFFFGSGNDDDENKSSCKKCNDTGISRTSSYGIHSYCNCWSGESQKSIGDNNDNDPQCFGSGQ